MNSCCNYYCDQFPRSGYGHAHSIEVESLEDEYGKKRNFAAAAVAAVVAAVEAFAIAASERKNTAGNSCDEAFSGLRVDCSVCV